MAPPADELDRSFDPGEGVTFANGSPGFINTVVVQNDGRILIGGFFDQVNGRDQAGIARLHADGSVDTSFTATLKPAIGELVEAIAVQSDGKILLGGNFLNLNGKVLQSVLARINANGTTDESFRPVTLVWGLRATVNALIPLPTGQILVGGIFGLPNSYPGPPRGLLRLNADGTRDTAYVGSVGNSSAALDIRTPAAFVTETVPDVSGGLLVAGMFVEAGGFRVSGFARFNSEGVFDGSFRPVGYEPAIVGCTLPCMGRFIQKAVVGALAVQLDGKILVNHVPEGLTINQHEPASSIQRHNRDGSIDPTFTPLVLKPEPLGATPLETAHALVVEADGSILLAGGFQEVNGQSRPGLARVNANGTLDDWMSKTKVAGSPAHTITTLTLQPDGRILMAGNFTNLAGVPRSGIARLFPHVPGKLVRSRFQNGSFSSDFVSEKGKTYQVESAIEPNNLEWKSEFTIIGDGSTKTWPDPQASSSQKLYRLKVDAQLPKP